MRAYSESTSKRIIEHADENGQALHDADLASPGRRSQLGIHEYEGHRRSYERYWRYSREKMEKLDAEGRAVFTPSKARYPQSSDT